MQIFLKKTKLHGQKSTDRKRPETERWRKGLHNFKAHWLLEKMSKVNDASTSDPELKKMSETCMKCIIWVLLKADKKLYKTPLYNMNYFKVDTFHALIDPLLPSERYEKQSKVWEKADHKSLKHSESFNIFSKVCSFKNIKRISRNGYFFTINDNTYPHFGFSQI